MKPTEQEIEDVIAWCAESVDSGRSNYFSMTYEQGVRAAIEWMLGEGECPKD